MLQRSKQRTLRGYLHGNYTTKAKGHDADIGVKTYQGKNKDGSVWEKVKTWFSLLAASYWDANYKLPVAFSITKVSDDPGGFEKIEKLQDTFKGRRVHPGCEVTLVGKAL